MIVYLQLCALLIGGCGFLISDNYPSKAKEEEENEEHRENRSRLHQAHPSRVL